MDEISKGVLSAKLLEACDCDVNNSIYAFVPSIDDNLSLYTNNLHISPQIIDSAISLFGGKKHYISKSMYFINLKNYKEQLINFFITVCDYIKYNEQRKIGQNRLYATLSYISSIYFNTYTRPIQFFLPHSSVCSGKWEFWDSVDFLAFKEKLQNKEFNFDFRDKIIKSNIWNIKFELNTFPLIVQRRLIKEKLLDKKLDASAMIKAVIIKMGEMGRPYINYEIIDYSIRELFTYLEEKKYLRVDREIEFLRRLDKEIIKILNKNLNL